MPLLVSFLVGFVALQHLVFMFLEMFLWTRPLGLKIFKQSQEFANSTAFLAKNQGLYNGFLVAGLVWSLLVQDVHFAFSLKIFFLVCVLIAGIYGSITASFAIFFIQALPAILALGAVWFARISM